MAERIDGKAVAAAVRQEVAQEVLRLKEELDNFEMRNNP